MRISPSGKLVTRLNEFSKFDCVSQKKRYLDPFEIYCDFDQVED